MSEHKLLLLQFAVMSEKIYFFGASLLYDLELVVYLFFPE